MVFRTLSVIALLFISSGLFSQSSKDTVWTTVDYSRAQRAASQEERSPRLVNHYIGLQANQLLRQLLNLIRMHIECHEETDSCCPMRLCFPRPVVVLCQIHV